MKDDIDTSENTLNSLSDPEIDDLRKQIREAAQLHSHAFLPFENLLGLSEGFVKELIDEKDDWAFIIKVAVIVEATLGRVINAFLQNPLIERHIRAIPMDGRTGKIQLARDLGIIGPKSMARLRALAEIRNDFAHNLGVVQLSIGGYLSRLPGADASALWDRLFAMDSGKRVSTAAKPKAAVEAETSEVIDGKLLIYSCAWLALSELAVAHKRISNDSIWRSALVVLGEAFLSRQRGDEQAAREKMRVALNTLKTMAEAPLSIRPKSVGEEGAEVGT